MSDIRDNYDQDTFEGFWQQKANETTATLQRLLDNDAAAFLNLALKEIETQLLSGAEVINNPLKVGILSQLGFDISSGKIPAFFTEIFGDNDTLPSLDVATSFGLTEDQFNSIPAQAERLEASEGPSQREITGRAGRKIYDKDNNLVGIVYDGVTYRQDDSGKWVSPDAVETDSDTTVLPAETEVTPEEGGTFTSEQLVGRYNDSPAAQDFGVFVTYDPETNTFIEDVSSFGFTGDAATNTYTPEEFMERLGVEGSFEETQVDPEAEAEEEEEEASDSEGWTWVNPDPDKELPRVLLDPRQLIDFNSGKDVVLSDGTVINNSNSEIIGGGAGGGMWVTPTGLESEVPRPEGTVNLEDLTEEQVGTFWPEIQESLEGLGDVVKQAVFGTSGVPKTPDELLEAIEEGVMEGLKGPIAVTFDPNEGLTLDIKIPVGFEINGNSIQLPIFNEDGEFILGESIVDEAGRIFATVFGEYGEDGSLIKEGILQQIGNIFTDDKGNVLLDIIDAGQVALGQLGINEEGLLTGALVDAAIGDFQYDPGTGEILEEGSIEDIGLDAGEENGLVDTVDNRGDDVVDRDDPEVIPLTGPDDPEELTEEPIKPPKGSQYIDDKAGNIVGAIGPDGTVYNVDENNEWSVSTSDVVTEGGTTVLPGETTIGAGSPYQDGSAAETFYGSFPEDTDGVDDDVVSGRGDDVVDRGDPEVTPLTDADTPKELIEDIINDAGSGDPFDGLVIQPDGGEVLQPDFGLNEDYGTPDPTTNGTDDGTDNGTDDPFDGLVIQPDGGEVLQPDGGDDVVTRDPIVTQLPPAGTSEELTEDTDDSQPPLTTGPVIDDDEPPEEPPLVGPPGKDGVDGVDGVDGAAGAAGAPARSRGYMGGLSYELPQFVGVQYQPKDYTVELDRIINESLFKGMI